MDASVNTTPHVGFRMLTSDVVDLTPDVLREFSSIAPSPIEREVNRARVKHLREKAENGTLVTFHWVTASWRGLLVRMNGQHSKIMLAEKEQEGSFPIGLKVHREHYEVDDDAGLALLFQQFDDRRSGRSSSDVAGVYQNLTPKLVRLDRKLSKLAIDGYAWYLRIIERAPCPIGDAIYTFFGDDNLHPFLEWWVDINTGKTPELRHKPVVGAVWATFLANESAARVFWEDVARACNPDDPAAEAQLDRWLLALNDRRLDIPGFVDLNRYQGCIYAWNAARDGKPITTIKYEIRKGNPYPVHN